MSNRQLECWYGSLRPFCVGSAPNPGMRLATLLTRITRERCLYHQRLIYMCGGCGCARRILLVGPSDTSPHIETWTQKDFTAISHDLTVTWLITIVFGIFACFILGANGWGRRGGDTIKRGGNGESNGADIEEGSKSLPPQVRWLPVGPPPVSRSLPTPRDLPAPLLPASQLLFFLKKYFLKILFVCYGTLYLTHFKTVKIKKIIHLILVLKFIISPHFSILWYPFSACNFFCIFLLKKKVSCDRSFRWDRMVRWKAYIYYYFCINHRYSVEFYPVD